MEQLNVGTNDLSSVVKKKVPTVAASVSSTKAFPTEVPIVVVASIPGRKVEEECWNYDLESRLGVVAARIQLEVAVAATLEASWLQETLPTASWVLGPYENPVK
jgi:hypothetical protein